MKTNLFNILPFLLILFLFFSSGCSRPVAEVDGKEIAKKEFLQEFKDRRLSSNNKNVDEVTLKNIAINSIIDRCLVLDEAGKRGFAISEKDIENRVLEFKNSFKDKNELEAFLKAREMSEKDLRKRIGDTMKYERFIFSLSGISDVSLEDLRNAYEANKQFLRDDKVRISMIEIVGDDNAKSIAQQIKKTSFERVVERLFSESKNDAAVTKQRWTSLNVFSQDLRQMIEGASQGAVIGPIKRKDSWYIIKVYEKKEYKSFDEAKEDIMFELLHKKRLVELEKWLEKRKEKAKIIVYADRL